jgi:hypothetical protein
MITAITADPLSTGSVGLSNYRTRPVEGERSVLPDSTPPAPKNSTSSDSGQFPRKDPPAEPAPEPEHFGAASMFAAAVIAGKMPPVPTTIEELIMRIGSIPLPPESEARLRDLIA